MVWGGGADQDEDDRTRTASLFCIAVFFAFLGALGKPSPFSLSLGFLGFAGGGEWFGGGGADHDYDDGQFSCIVFFCIAVLFALLGALGKLKPFSLSLVS